MDDIYMNKNGFKCARAQLAKTDGRDPQAYERAKMLSRKDDGTMDEVKLKAEVAKLPIKAAEHAESAQ